MPISFSSNILSLSVQRQMNDTTKALAKNFSRLASGLRVNSSVDDPAGMAIAERLTAQVRGLSKATQNANDGISLSQVADGALSETVNALQRVRELAVEAKNSTKSQADRLALQADVDTMMAEVTRIATDTQFNGLRLLAGSFTGMVFAIGANTGNTITMDITTASAQGIGLGGSGGSLALVSNANVASTTIGLIDTALDSITTIRSGLGGMQNRFESIVSQLDSLSMGYQSARSSIMDADVASETAALTRNTILQEAGIAVLAQANLQPKILLQLLQK